jgi:hypothetical protein
MAGETAVGDAARAADAADAAKAACASFVGAALVLMADGSHKPIGDVKVGDEVQSYDPGTGAQSVEAVTAVWPHADAIVTLALSDGTTVQTTDAHPWWDATTRTYTRTDHLETGDRVLTADGSTLSVAGISGPEGTRTVTNLSVTGPRTYYVADASVLVHSCASNIQHGPVPEGPTTTPDSIDATGSAPAGYKPGTSCSNDGRGGTTLLPGTDASGNPVVYTEWDTNPLVPGQNKGSERLVTGSDGSAYYTPDHYITFYQMR